MHIIKTAFKLIKDWIIILSQFIQTWFMSETEKNLEIIALRSQLSIYQQQNVNNKKN